MITAEKTTITVEARIHAPVEKVWSLYTDPTHIVRWNNASSDWYTSKAENDLKIGGKFFYRMEARDGSDGFDFTGEYDSVILLRQIKYTISDGRTVHVMFSSEGDDTLVKVNFETEQMNPLEMQQEGWQAILDNFKRYVEKPGKTEVVHFEVEINAPAEKVYRTVIDEKQYSEWTAEFNPTSHFKGSWEKGSRIQFIGDAPDGSVGGMVSQIKENIPNRYISIEHLGLIINGKEVLCGPEVDTWAGATENYTFIEEDGKTRFLVNADTDEKYKTYFVNTWPKALQRLKSICENTNPVIR